MIDTQKYNQDFIEFCKKVNEPSLRLKKGYDSAKKTYSDIEQGSSQPLSNADRCKLIESGLSKEFCDGVDLYLAGKDLYIIQDEVYDAIWNYTLGKKENLKKCVKELKIDKFEWIHITLKNDKTISFRMASNFLRKCAYYLRELGYEAMNNEFEDEINKIGENLESEKREGSCHSSIIPISIFLDIHFSNSVVTGYIKGLSESIKYIHSWLEFTYEGKEYVIDSTLNILMLKDEYYWLNNIQEKVDILSRVSGENIRQDNRNSRNT